MRGRPRGSKNKPKQATSPQRTMFTLPEVNEDHLMDLVLAYGGQDRVCRDLKISPDLLGKYLRAEAHPPYSLLLAIYWQGPNGFNHAFSESHATHLHNFGMRRIAEERWDTLVSMVDQVVDKLGADHKVSALLTTAKARAIAGAPLWLDRRELVDASSAGQERRPTELDQSPRNSGPEATKLPAKRRQSRADAPGGVLEVVERI